MRRELHVNATLRRRILELRREYGLTLAVIAVRVGLNQSTVCEILKRGAKR